jgi:hypothetical protein
VISDQSSGNPPKLQLRLINRKFALQLRFVNLLLKASRMECRPLASLVAHDGVIQLPFPQAWPLLMELARFPIAPQSRYGQLAELSLRGSLLCLACLPLVKCRSLPRECSEKPFRVVSRRESGVDSFLPWRAD